MIYLFAGDDSENKIKNYEKFVDNLDKRAEFFSISRNNFDENIFETLMGGAGLFTQKNVIFFSNILEREDERETILKNLEKMSSSQNDFIFLEGKMAKGPLDAFKKVRAEVNYFELPKEKKERFNNFLLANALADRDKLRLWIYYRQAVDLGVSLEELTGVMFWKTKDMITKKNFGKFKIEELQKISFNLATLLPKSRGEAKDDEAMLEKYLLEIF